MLNRRNETALKDTRGRSDLQYVDLMSLYPYACKYFKFAVEHNKFTWEARVKI